MKNFFSMPARLSAAAIVAVVVTTELSDFSVTSYGITAGSRTPAIATLTSLSRSPTPVVTFSSSNSSVAQVPLSKLASTANGTVVVEVTGVAPGCAQIKASYGGRTRTDDVVVHPVATTTSFTMSVPDRVLPFPGLSDAALTKTMSLTTADRTSPTTGTLTLNRAVWKLSSSNTSIATVPDSVIQISTTTPFKIAGRGEGCATITAKLGTQSVSKTVMTRYIGG